MKTDSSTVKLNMSRNGPCMNTSIVLMFACELVHQLGVAYVTHTAMHLLRPDC
jgi:hypothetical protein